MKIKNYLSAIVLVIVNYACSSSHQQIQITRFEKKMTSNNDTSFSNECRNWKLVEKDALDIIKSSDTISAHEKNYLFNTLPCEYSGTLRMKDKYYNFIINAGSYVVIFNKDSTLYLGYFKKGKSYFISPPATGEIQP